MMHKSLSRTRPDRGLAAARRRAPIDAGPQRRRDCGGRDRRSQRGQQSEPGVGAHRGNEHPTLWHSLAFVALSARRCVRAPPLAPTCVAAAEMMLGRSCRPGPCRQCVTAGSAASTPISSATSTGQPARGLPITMGGTQSPAAATPSRYAFGVCQRAVQLNTRSPAMVPTYRQVRGTVTAVAAPACCVRDAHRRPSDAAECAPPAGFW